MFELKARDGLARLGILKTAHGEIPTPALLPVINPHLLIISPSELQKIGARGIITNAYIIYKDENLRAQALSEGIHSTIKFNGPIMTDSGSFQMYMYGVDITNLDIVSFQRDIGSDIGTILDIFSESSDPSIIENEVKQTIIRAQDSVTKKGEMLLACTVQGGTIPSLRRECARALSTLAADIYPIGGVVPLMEQQRYSDLARIIIECKKELPPGRAVHLFGAGHPMMLPMATLLGCDLFDSASYIKYARDNRLIFQDKTLKLEELEEMICPCPVCSTYTPEDLKTIEQSERIKQLAVHNLWQTFSEIRRIRQSIREGSLWELVEQRATAHPSLIEALEIIKSEKHWLEKWESISKRRAFKYTSASSMHRPLVYRLQKRIKNRYTPSFGKTIIFSEIRKPYSSFYWMKHFAANVIIESPFGAIPLELDEIYPISQSVFPIIVDKETERAAQREATSFYKKMPTITSVDSVLNNAFDYDIRKVKAVADYQFGKGAGNALFEGAITFSKSKSTGKIRNIYSDGSHIASMRASDGFFSLKFKGGERLHALISPPSLRVVINDDAAPFVEVGRNVFSKFVLDCCNGLRPYDEVLIVDKNDRLLAIGQCLLTRKEMFSFTCGVAVKTREGNKKDLLEN